jgi:outer membrane beta-barrel protein
VRGVALAVALAVTAVPLLAHAQRKSPLADAPAIRKRYELRSTRLELGAGVGSTIDQDFYHTVLIDLRLGFHITDWLSIAGFAGFAAANLSTGFQDKVTGSLGTDPAMLPREPTRQEALASMEKIKTVLAGQLEFTPFTGKYSMFGKLFAAYDVYLFVGPGLLNVEPTNSANLMPCTSTSSSFSCGESGFKFGANFGVGFHSYFNQWLGLNIELRDILAQLNPSGRDVNGDQKANTADQAWNHTYMFGANLVVYLPTVASISQ